LEGSNDAGDVLAMSIGFELQAQYPGGTVTGQAIEDAIYEHWDEWDVLGKLTPAG